MTKHVSRFTFHVSRISLAIKLLAAFIVVVIVAVVVVALMSRQSAQREFTRFIQDSQAVPPDELLSRLATLFAQQGNWDGADEVLGQFVSWSPDQDRPRPMLLVDAEGRVIAYNWGPLIEEQLSDDILTHGWPIQVDGETAGTLLVPGAKFLPPNVAPQRLSPEEARTLERVQRAIVVAGLVAGAVALVLAGGLAWGLVRPLRRLTAAAEGIARGDLSQRVPVGSDDEIGELAATFNTMAAELERAEQLRRNMTADVAHELRTPLSVVRGKLEGILDGVYPATPEHIQPVLEATELLTVLVEDLRLLAQAEAGKLALEKRAVDIGDLLRDAQVNFEPQAADRGVALVLDLPAALPPVQADWHRIAQVLGNLLTNALRHTPAGGRVTLSAGATAGPLALPATPAQQAVRRWGASEVKVTVTDTGTGIPDQDLPYVFDRFWRGEKSRSRAGGGSGLGLAIARQLVELHGGTIGAESVPGDGSTFWFTLPVA